MRMIKPVVAVALASLLSAPLVAFAEDAPVAAPAEEKVNMPMIEVSETDFGFGRVAQDASIAHTYWIKNVGGDTLRIADVKPGCGCTKAPIEKKELAVGDSTRVELIFSTGKYSSSVRKSATIMSNAAGVVPRLGFSADVRPNTDSLELFTVVPSRIDMDKSEPEAQKKPWQYDLTLKNTTDMGLTFSLISAPSELVMVDFPNKMTVDAGKEKTFAVKIDPSAAESIMTKSFTIEASDDAHTRMTIPIVKSMRTGTASTMDH